MVAGEELAEVGVGIQGLFGEQRLDPQRRRRMGQNPSLEPMERLIHLNDLTPPPTDRWVRVRFPDRLAEIVDLAAVPGWDAVDMMASRRFGDGWLASRRSLILIVPSAVTKQDQNAVINPAHAGFPTIEVTSERPVRWDSRLFRRPG